MALMRSNPVVRDLELVFQALKRQPFKYRVDSAIMTLIATLPGLDAISRTYEIFSYRKFLTDPTGVADVPYPEGWEQYSYNDDLEPVYRWPYALAYATTMGWIQKSEADALAYSGAALMWVRSGRIDGDTASLLRKMGFVFNESNLVWDTCMIHLRAALPSVASYFEPDQDNRLAKVRPVDADIAESDRPSRDLTTPLETDFVNLAK